MAPKLSPPRRGADDLAAWGSVLYFAATFAAYCVWNAFLAERSGDPAILEQVLWSASQGHGLRGSLEGGLHHLTVHFSPFLYLLVPLYKVWPSLHGIHLLVCALTAAAGWLLYRFARPRLGPLSALGVQAAFLLHPTIILQTFMEIHEQAFAILPLVGALTAFVARRSRAVLGWCALLLLVREDNVVVVFALALLAAFELRRPALGLALLGVGAAWLGLYAWIGVAMLGGGHLPRVFAGTYDQLGSSPVEVLHSLIADPSQVVRHVLSDRPLGYLAQLLIPFLLVLPFGAWLWVAALPQLSMILLANPASRMFEIRMHYSIVPVVVFAAASIATISRWETAPNPLEAGRVVWTRRAARAAVLGLLGASLLSVPVWALRARERLNPYRDQIHRMLSVIPDTASVRAPMYLANRLARRRQLEFCWTYDGATEEYVIAEERNRLFFRGTTIEKFYSPELSRYLRGVGYEPVYERDGWHVFRKSRR
jgi:uncharacterized membrane protein